MDPLRDEGLAYAEALEKSGYDFFSLMTSLFPLFIMSLTDVRPFNITSTRTTLKVYPGMPHAFYVYPNLAPSTEYFQTIVQWISGILGGEKNQ